MMSFLIVVTFDDAERASQVRQSLRKGERGGYISLDDSAIVEKDKEGKVHVKDEMDRGVKVGAVGGGFLGLLIAGLFFPVVGLVLGALGGILVGSSLNKGIQKKFIKEVSDSLQPDSSAIFFIVRDANPDYALGVLRNYEGTVFHTSLAPEEEEELRHALRKK
jgi:uncharacterized membrane protein